MKRLFAIAAAALALAATASAQTPSQTPSPKPAPSPTPSAGAEPSVDKTLVPDFKSVDVSIGAIQRDVDTGSSKFFEYRDIPNGGVVPRVSFAGKHGEYRWEFEARDVTQKDQTYFLNAEKGTIALHGTYVGIPHNFG